MRTLLGCLLLASAVAAQPQPGELAPDPGVELFVGAPVVASWEGLAGHAIVMDLWATWCAPCVATLPHMAALADSFATRDVQFLSVTDEPYETVRPFLEERTLAGWVGIDEDGSSREAYGVSGIPAVVLVYPDGRFGAVTHPDEVDAEVIEALLAGDSLAVRPALTGLTIRDQVEQMRATRPAVADGPPTFSASWAPEGARGGFRLNVEEGWLSANGGALVQLLTAAWASHYPFRSDPLGQGLRHRFVDAPDSLEWKAVDVEMNRPSLTRETFGAHLIAELGRTLGLEVRFENRPTVVYVLRQSPGRPLTLQPSGPPFGASSRGHVFSARGVTAAQLARALGGGLGHPVFDETGLEGTYAVTLELDPDVVDFEPSVMTWESVEGVRAGLLAETGLELAPEVRPVEWMVVRPANP